MTEQNVQKRRYLPDIEGLRNGLLFIFAGVLIFASNENWLFDWFWWFVFIWGLVLLAEGLYREIKLADSHKSPGLFIWGAILAGFGLYQIYNLIDWWPLILVTVGLILIWTGLRRDSQTQ